MQILDLASYFGTSSPPPDTHRQTDPPGACRLGSGIYISMIFPHDSMVVLLYAMHTSMYRQRDSTLDSCAQEDGATEGKWTCIHSGTRSENRKY